MDHSFKSLLKFLKFLIKVLYPFSVRTGFSLLLILCGLTPSNDVKNYDRCLRVKDLHSDAAMEVETLVK